MALFPTLLNPLRPINRLDPISEFENMFSGLGLRPLTREYQNTLEMRMDVTEDDKSYRVMIDMPGVKKDDIDVSVEDNQIIISAVVAREKSHENEKELCSERYIGKAYRTFSLPSEVDNTKSQAHYDSGVLTLTLPKKAGTASRHLSIN